ncbi:MAG: sigma-70 family RNA polymerase sigma factor [Planctomycetota bacterium]
MRKADEIFDEWLVLQCQGGSASALTKLVQRWQPRLLGFAIRLLSDRDAAEDAVQSSWVEIVRRIRSVKDPGLIRAWMFRIVANKCADIIRKRTKRRRKESEDAADQVADPSTEKRRMEEEKVDQMREVRQGLRLLDPTHREILRLHYSEGQSVDAIAKRLSIPVGTVKSRLFHARKKLKQTLSGENHE